MFEDGPKRQGRFIKKGSKVASSVALQDFPFAEINTSPTLSTDNASRSIIHSQYHETVAIDAATRSPDKFDDDLVGARDRRPVLIPLDFTAEWERTKSQRKDRILRADDDDDFDYEAAVRAAQSKSDDSESPAEALAPGSRAVPRRSAVAAPASPTSPEGAASAAEADDAVAAMQAAGFRFSKSQTADDEADAESASASSPPPSATPASPAASSQAGGAAKLDAVAGALQTPASSSFIPMAASEEDTAEEYKRRLVQKELDEKERARLEDEAKARGYRDGFRIGEEKGATVARQNAGLLFGKVGELIGELGNLRQVILDNVQENFYEICQAMAEALFKREFTIHPDTFVAVIKRAIDEAVEPGKIKVHVHPEMYERITALGAKDLESALVRDAGVEPSDFKIETEQSVVDANLSKIVADFLTQADLSLVDHDAEPQPVATEEAG